MKKQSGITLISLVITIVLLLIITGTTVYTSVNRFKINNLKKMYNDIELLDDKIDNYYMKYGGLPVLKNENNEPIKYTYSEITDKLKDGVRKVDYIESTGTQWIDTGVLARTEKYKVVYDMQSSETGNKYLGANGILQIQIKDGIYWITTSQSATKTNIEAKNRNIITSEGQRLNGQTTTSLTINDVTKTGSWDMEYYGEIMLFGMGNATSLYNTITMRLYGCEIYENDILIRDYIPAIDKDNVACLYDKVNDKFYYNSGTGNFKTNLDEEESTMEENVDTNFIKDVNDNENYYIIDLSAIGDITLNYGKEGYENPNSSDDVYIINEKSHTVYYVRGIEYTDGKLYHSKKVDENTNEDTIPPTRPEINVISETDTSIEVEIIPGKDNISGVEKTTYTLDGTQYTINDRDIIKIGKNLTHTIIAKTDSNNGESSETILQNDGRFYKYSINQYFDSFQSNFTNNYDEGEYNTIQFKDEYLKGTYKISGSMLDEYHIAFIRCYTDTNNGELFYGRQNDEITVHLTQDATIIQISFRLDDGNGGRVSQKINKKNLDYLNIKVIKESEES